MGALHAKKKRRRADAIAAALTDEEFLGLEANQPRLEASRTRHHLQLHPDIKVSAEHLFDLVRAETGSREAAEHAAKEYMAVQVRRGETPA